MFHKTAAQTFICAIVLLIAALSGEARAQGSTNNFQGTKSIESIIAWVNNDIILKSEYDKRLAEIRQELSADPKLKGAQLEEAVKGQSRGALGQMINESLLMQKAKEMGLSADLEVIKAMEKMRQDRKLPSREALEKEIVAQGYTVDEVQENIRTRYLSESVMQREVYSRVTITTDDLRKYYDEHQKDFDKPAGIHLREITVITENRGPEETATQKKKAEDALAALKKGDDFSAVAAKYSESATASEGGDFGFFTKGELSPSLEAIVSKLDKGQVTDVLTVVGAFMIIKLDAKHDGGVLPFELAQKEIQNVLWAKALPPKEKEYLNKLRNEGYIRLAEGYVDSGAPAAADKVSELK